MFSSIGWAEIAGILVLALILIDPEKVPGLIKDVRAAIFAARRAINNAKKELDGELGEEFEEFKKPLGQLAQWQRMGPRAALTRALFEEDENFLDDFDPKTIMGGDTAGQAYRRSQRDRSSGSAEGPAQPPHPVQPQQPTEAPRPGPAESPAPPAEKPGFSWEDVT